MTRSTAAFIVCLGGLAVQVAGMFSAQGIIIFVGIAIWVVGYLLLLSGKDWGW